MENQKSMFTDQELKPVYQQNDQGENIIPMRRLENSGDTIEGIYIESKQVTPEEGRPFYVHYFSDNSGAMFGTYGAYQINKTVTGKEGYGFRITYLGKQSINNGTQEVKNYDIRMTQFPVKKSAVRSRSQQSQDIQNTGDAKGIVKDDLPI